MFDGKIDTSLDVNKFTQLQSGISLEYNFLRFMDFLKAFHYPNNVDLNQTTIVQIKGIISSLVFDN